jgi:hypothetical protein
MTITKDDLNNELAISWMDISCGELFYETTDCKYFI